MSDIPYPSISTVMCKQKILSLFFLKGKCIVYYDIKIIITIINQQ